MIGATSSVLGRLASSYETENVPSAVGPDTRPMIKSEERSLRYEMMWMANSHFEK